MEGKAQLVISSRVKQFVRLLRNTEVEAQYEARWCKHQDTCLRCIQKSHHMLRSICLGGRKSDLGMTSPKLNMFHLLFSGSSRKRTKMTDLIKNTWRYFTNKNCDYLQNKINIVLNKKEWRVLVLASTGELALATLALQTSISHVSIMRKWFIL